MKGKYRDFDTNWYYDVGAKICMTMLPQCFTPFISAAFEPITLAVLRWILDRCFERHLRKITNVQEREAKLLEKQGGKNPEADENAEKEGGIEMSRLDSKPFEGGGR